MYREMSFSGSSLSRCRSWATMRFRDLVVDRPSPWKTIRSLSRRL